MTEQERIRVSRFLSKHLRHAPQAIGIVLGNGGWVSVEALLAVCARSGFAITREQLAEVVSLNDKQRFSLNESGTLIRANQGHSVEVELDLSPVAPPDVLYHGTHRAVVNQILQQGLKKMSRHHVHLSIDIPTALRVGSRRGHPVILSVESRKMHTDGHCFYVTANGVWLTDAVPPLYLTLLTTDR